MATAAVSEKKEIQNKKINEKPKQRTGVTYQVWRKDGSKARDCTSPLPGCLVLQVLLIAP